MKAVWFNQLDFGSLCRSSRLELARAFARLGHRLRIVGRYRRTRPRFASLTPRPLLLEQHLPDPLGGLLFQLQAFIFAAFEIVQGVDLIVVDHFCVLAMFPFNLLSKAGLLRTKFILDIRSAPVDMIGTRYAVSRGRYLISIRWAKIFYDGITVITDLYREDISSRFRIPRERIGVWGSGVSTRVFDPREVDRTHAERIQCQLAVRNSLVIMYHGVLSPYRGLQETVRALALLNAGEHRQAVLVLLGDGPAVEEIEHLAKAENVQNAVRRLDPVPHEDVPQYLSVCDAGILPFPDSDWWGMSSPLKLMEYLALEKPVILTDIPAHRSVMGDAPCAFYARDSSPVSIAEAMRKLVQRKAALPQIGKQGRRIVLEKFTWERQSQNLLDYVERLDKRRGR